MIVIIVAAEGALWGAGHLQARRWCLCLHVLFADGLVQGCGNSSVIAMELPQPCTKLDTCVWNTAL